jgi:CRISPR/Cas system-associated protein Csm6
LHSEEEEAIKEMMDTKGTGVDDVPGNVLKLLGKVGLKIMTQFCNYLNETADWPKDINKVTRIAFREKPKATKCGENRSISLNTHTTKIIAKIIKRRIERKIEVVQGEVRFGFRREKRN